MASGNKCACVDLVGKELTERCEVRDSVQGGGYAKPYTEGVPAAPGSGFHGRSAWSSSRGNLYPNNVV
eukprot:2353212-Ditylum_brightwellii.AAC.1